MKKTCKIYIITNTVNDKVYIGQTTNDITTRFKQHCNTKYTKLGKAISNIGKSKFSISVLEDNILDLDSLAEREQYYINKYNSINNGYNSSKATRSQVKNLEYNKKLRFTTTLDDEIIKQAKIKAIEEGISVAELIEKILKEYLKK